MLHVHSWKKVHLVGIGGINMSAVAKLLLNAGAKVTGSDLVASDMIEDLQKKGAIIKIGPHSQENVPLDCDAVIHTSAAPDTNPERIAAKNRNLPDITNFEWMGQWFLDKRVALVTGTHGKSTTLALLGEMCRVGGLDPTVVLGSKVPGWPDGNLLLGKSDLVLIEGDEYAKHFLEFHPEALIINNIELDHTDVYATVDDVRKTFERLLHQVKSGAAIVVNGEDPQIEKAIKPLIATHQLEVVRFGKGSAAVRPRPYEAMVEMRNSDGHMIVSIDHANNQLLLESLLMGEFNGMNIAAAALLASKLGVNDENIKQAVKDFKGIWRRMELLGMHNGVPVYSDYGHHPTAVCATLKGMRTTFPGKRIVLCFQPHHKNRTKHLFDQFVSCFNETDILVLCEIYDVPGRSADKDSDVTSNDLLDAISKSTDQKNLKQSLYAPDPAQAVDMTLKLLQPNDVCIFMGAGDIDEAVRKVVA